MSDYVDKAQAWDGAQSSFRKGLEKGRSESAETIVILLAALKWSKLQERMARGMGVAQAQIEVDVDMSSICAELKLSKPNQMEEK